MEDNENMIGGCEKCAQDNTELEMQGGKSGDKGKKHYSDTRINAYATAVMALLTLCALAVSLVESHKNQRQRVKELELSRVQTELKEVKSVCFDLINNGVYEYVLDLSNNMMYRNDFEGTRSKLDVLSTDLETKCNQFTMTITPFGIPTKLEDGSDVYVTCNSLMEKLYDLQSFLSFFVDVSNVKDMGTQKDLIKSYMDFVELSPVIVKFDKDLNEVDEGNEITFSDYCEGCDYDFELIKKYAGLYLGSTVESIFEEKVALYNYVSHVWTMEVDKLNVIYDRLGMSPIENVMKGKE